MLYEKNGVITEDRFKNLTEVQWWFHYKEIIKMKNKEIDVKADIMKMCRSMFDILVDRIEMVGVMANPELGKQILDKRQSDKTKADVESGDDELLQFAKSLEDVPETLTVTLDKSSIEDKFFLPKYKRKLGIDIDKKAGD